jgi:thioredoxin-like negative regulator of GroEL
MKSRNVLIALALLIVGALGFMWHQDYEYRQLHGRVTEVSLVTWEQEVDQTRGAKPVLVYFYNEKTDAGQREIVTKFAWDHAHDVKVVAVNTSHVENVPIALAHGGLRTPSFAVLSSDKEVLGSAGVSIERQDLERVLTQAQSASPAKP